MKAAASTAGGAVVQMRSYTRNPEKPKIDRPLLTAAKPGDRESPSVVRISSASRMAALARSAVLSAPEIRTEAVEPLRTALNAGRYQFSPQRVAEKMVGGWG
jgi:flagellar biosynthesis anti-sigma factor FlgM